MAQSTSNIKLPWNRNILFHSLKVYIFFSSCTHLSNAFSISTSSQTTFISKTLLKATSIPDTSTNQTNTWAPKIKSLNERRSLRGLKHESELIGTKRFHHVEFYCGDAKSTAYRFSLALGMPVTCVTNQSTGNDQCSSYGIESGDVRFIFTAPYSQVTAQFGQDQQQQQPSQSNIIYDAPDPIPSFSVEDAHSFFKKHGIAAKAVALEVHDASDSFTVAVANGATPVLSPTTIHPSSSFMKECPDASSCQMSEVKLYGDVVLRFVSFDSNEKDSTDSKRPFLPNYALHPTSRRSTYGLQRIDHAVGNVPNLLATLEELTAFTGFHEFAEFTSEDVGTIDSGLNSVVLASDSENVLLPLNEPTEGRRKSQIKTYLEQNEGPGLQHLALKTDDIFHTISKMRMAEEELGGFELMSRPSDQYYAELPSRLGDQLSPEQYEKIESLGILADADDEGILLQIFTKPVGDRPTFFIEIIQRIGCIIPSSEVDTDSKPFEERPGCGGFGQGNFKELFKSIEDHEKTLKI